MTSRTAKPVHKENVPFREIVDRVKAVAAGSAPLPEWAGKTVYVNEAARHYWTARKVVEHAKLAALTKLIADNQDLLGAIRKRTPASVAELARCVQRSDSNVSRSLGKLVKFGIVSLVDTSGRAKQPVLATDKLLLEIDVVSGQAVIHQHGERRATAAKAKKVAHA
jgi:predicted transcriptional regulator